MNQNTSQGSEERRTESIARPKRARSESQIDQLARAAQNAREGIVEYVKERPIAALGIAAGAGFVAGCVLGSRVGRIALMVAAGSVAQDLLNESLGEGGVKKLVTDELSRFARSRESS
jgi:hypothetical protein